MTALPVANRWNSGQLKNVAAVTLGKMLQSSDSGDDVLASYMRAANVQPDGRLKLEPKQMWFNAAELEALSLRRGDVVVVEGGVGGYGRAAYLTQDLAGWGFQNSINRLRPLGEADGRFLAYYLIALRASGFIERYCNVVSMPHLTAEKLASLPTPIPEAWEQRAIADYLDRETARIDTLIDEQQRLIEMLRERRQAVIDVEINERDGMPVVQLRSLVAIPIDAGVDEAGDPSNPTEWPRFVRTTDISNLTTLDPSKRVTISPETAAPALLQRNDLVATRAGATVGKTYIHASGEAACYAGYLVRIRPDTEHVEPMYIAYWTLSRHYLDQVAVGAVKSTIENYSAAKYRATRVPLPELADQRRISAYLDEQTSKIDALIVETETFIELARERRSALITAAVTGQIDVREGVA